MRSDGSHDESRYRLLGVGDPRTHQGLAQRGRPDVYESSAIKIAESGWRNDGALETEPLGLLQSRGGALNSAELSAETKLADEHGPRVRRPVTERRSERDRESEVGSGLAHAKTADEIHVHVMGAEGKACALREDREQHGDTLRIGTVHGPPRKAEARGSDERLHLDEQRTRSLDGRHDDAARDAAAALFEEDLRRIRDLAQT